MLGLGLSINRAVISLLSVIRSGLQMWLGFTKANVLGKELVVDFPSGWSVSNDASISGGKIIFLNADEYSEARNTSGNYLIEGNHYIAIINIESQSGTGNLAYRFDGGAVTTITGGAGIKTIHFIAPSDGEMWIQTNGTPTSLNAVISEFSVKEVAQFAPDKSLNTNEAKLLTGKALEFNGNDTVDCGNTNSVSDYFTISAWVYLTTGGNHNAVFNTAESSNPYGGTDCYIRNSDGAIGSYADGFVYSSNKISKDVWSRVVWRFYKDTTNGTIDASINGGLFFNIFTGNTGSSNLLVNDGKVSIGSFRGGANYFSGKLSDIQIYNAAWTSGDAAYDYANPNNLATDNPSTSLTLSNLSAYYTLSEGSGNIAFDSTGLGAELVTNGDFAIDNTIWLSQASSLNWDSTNNNLSATWSNSGSVFGIKYVSGITRYTSIKITFRAKSTNIDDEGFYMQNELSNLIEVSNPNLTTTYQNYVFLGGVNRADSKINLICLTSGLVSNANITYDNISVKLAKADDGTGAFLNATPAVIGATWVDKQPTIPQLGMVDWSKSSNLLAYSEDFDNANWTKTGTTVQLNSITSPDGYNNGTKLKASADGSASRRIRSTMSPIKDNQTYTYSIYVKKADVNFFNISIATTSFPSSSGAWFNVESGTVTRTYSGLVSSSITNVGDGWFRCTVTATSDSTSGNNVDLYMSSVDQTLTYTGVTGEGLYIFGAQFEESTTAGSYIRTGFSTAIDATLIQNPNDLGKDVLGNALRLREGGFNLDGSGYAEVADDSTISPTSAMTLSAWVFTNTQSDRGIVAKWITGGKDYMIYKVTGNSFRFYIGTNYTTATSVADNVWVNIVGTYDGSNMKIYINGDLKATTSRVGSIPASNHPLEIGRYNANQNTGYSERIDDVLVYNETLTLTEIANNYKIGLSKHS